MAQVTDRGAEIPENIVSKRAEELLALGKSAVTDLGRKAGSNAADALKLLEDISGSTGTLMDVNQKLIPLITNFKDQSKKPSWWCWFTGEQLEKDVFFERTRLSIENLIEAGQQADVNMHKHAQALRNQQKLMAIEVKLLELDIKAGHLLTSSAYAFQLIEANLIDEELDRLIRRISNLEAMATATSLTQAQYAVASQHAVTVSDRYHEIRNLLLPIWKQNMGFDLFSRQVAGQIH